MNNLQEFKTGRFYNFDQVLKFKILKSKEFINFLDEKDTENTIGLIDQSRGITKKLIIYGAVTEEKVLKEYDSITNYDTWLTLEERTSMGLDIFGELLTNDY